MKAFTNFEAHLAGGYVHFYANGHYSGAYEFPTIAEAEKDAKDRRRRFGCIGCGYVVSESPEDPRA